MALDVQRRRQLMDGFARRAAQLGLTAPAILFLETYKPLAFLGAQIVWALQPFLSMGLPPADVSDFARLLEDRANVEQLIHVLESSQLDGSPDS